jgi:cyclophilin family peptidyl-prolyl cis-trans isomerase
MAKQQAKKRRKRYAPGSAYAGDVRPAGVLGVLASPRTMRIVFIGMAAALVLGALGGGIITFTGFGESGGDDQETDFVEPGGGTPGSTPDAEPTASVRQYSAPPAMTIDTSKSYTATIKTSEGDIQVELLPQQAPQTVNNFVFLSRDGFYDNLVFLFADPNFSVNAGDPTCTSAGASVCRGDRGPGYELDEQVSGAFEAGTLGMSNGSQFFIALTASPSFDEFTPFGRVTSGLDVAQRIQKDTVISSIEISEA